MPEAVEWIDDTHCNVMFRNDEWVTKCLLGMAKMLKVSVLACCVASSLLQRVRSGPAEDGEVADSDSEEVTVRERPVESTSVVANSESLDMDATDVGTDKHESIMKRKRITVDDMDDTSGGEKTAIDISKAIVFTDTEAEVDVTQIQVPPGRWRVCTRPHKQSPMLLVRYPHLRDHKQAGAMFRSEYYAK
jgi:hypothetical protein